MRPRLVLFVRAPALGQGKRRIARDLGDVAALRFERRMIARLLRRLAGDPRWRLQIAVTPDRMCREAARWRHRIKVAPQGDGNLGLRMRRAIANAPAGPVVLIGSDIPAIAAHHIAAAFRLLGKCDVVFGPAIDGGFWLVGARRRPRLPSRLFERVRWSSSYALADTLAGLPRGVTVGFVDMLEDVDDGDSYRRLNPQRGF
ncbi:MAG: TIGR04282 family arsenosugar biosynthesis glycosyltransferase [Alphaproteobacteria bacterium]|nr:TIGR04282 family arsenosugar biosynthesis glycosyltransferase [Alphaproteobacteria bacterium]